MISEAVIENGVMPFENADDANVPVSLFLSKIGDSDRIDEPADHLWRLTADNYMPRKGMCTDCAYCVSARSRDDLAAIVRKHVLPLYHIAVQKLDLMAFGEGEGNLYYWEHEKPRPAEKE